MLPGHLNTLSFLHHKESLCVITVQPVQWFQRKCLKNVGGQTTDALVYNWLTHEASSIVDVNTNDHTNERTMQLF